MVAEAAHSWLDDRSTLGTLTLWVMMDDNDGMTML